MEPRYPDSNSNACWLPLSPGCWAWACVNSPPSLSSYPSSPQFSLFPVGWAFPVYWKELKAPFVVCVNLSKLHHLCEPHFAFLQSGVEIKITLQKISFAASQRRRSIYITKSRDFPGGPVLWMVPFHCRGRKFDPGLGTKLSCATAKK